MRFAPFLLALACAACSGRPAGDTHVANSVASAAPAPAPAPETVGDAGAAGSSTDAAATDATPGDACQPESTADSCRALLAALSSAAAAKSCDTGFRPTHTRFVDCSPSDLECAIRMQGWNHAPIYGAASADTAPACLAECESGNGASCVRLAHLLERGATASAPDADPRRTCARHFARQACRLGLPYACDEPPKCPDLPDRKQAYQKLAGACDGKHASWECFYAIHSREMLWGAGPSKDVARDFRDLCTAPCPTGTARCYRQMACEVVRLFPSRAKP